MSEGELEVGGAVVRSLCAAPGEAHLDAVAARVARAVAEVEPPGERGRWEERFRALIARRALLPSVPILANAGRTDQLAACYVLEPEDSLDSIYRTLGLAAAIQQGGGGAGVDFSRLRPAGARIVRSGGISPGPLAFVELFAHSALVNRRAGRRPGAHLAVLAVTHPDAPELVRAARTRRESLAGVGLALALEDEFLRGAVAPGSSESRLLDEIAAAILATGEPSLLFVDTIAAANPLPELGRIRAANPCGEQPLLPGESCLLASLDLPAFADERGELDWSALGLAAESGVRFLDDALERARFPSEAIERASLRTRKVGLGYLGLADLALRRGLEFDGAACLELAGEVTRFVAERAHAASRALAGERAAFPAHHRGHARRNATVLAIAPTGTLRLIAGSSGGIEPLLDPVHELELAGRGVRFVDRHVRAWLGARTPDPEAVLQALARGEPSESLPGLSDSDRRLLRRGGELDPAAQLGIQAEVQRFVDGAVSKTVHLPLGASAQDVRKLMLLAHRTRCKGVALYRAPRLGGVPANDP
jgi:ribonucleoside-diphosphate reductase alpha chain